MWCVIARFLHHAAAGCGKDLCVCVFCVLGLGFHWSTERRYWLCMRSLAELVRRVLMAGSGAPKRVMESTMGAGLEKG